MIYLIGGAGRAGKSTLCKKILKNKLTPYFFIDYLLLGFENGAPQLNVNHKQSTHERAEKMLPIIDAMVENISSADEDYILEGDILLPEFLRKQQDIYKGEIKTCLLGYTDIDLNEKLSIMRKFHGKVKNDWFVNISDEEAIIYLEKMQIFSREIKAKSEELGIAYFDESVGFENSVNDAYDYLTS